MAKANHRSNYPPGRQQQGNRRNDDQRNDLTLTAPYNFIPLHKQVVRPEWASLISHDVPLPDAQYGTLQLTIKAEQPIFTRNNVSRRVTNENEKKEKGSHFSKSPNNRYFLPGSSIKGAIRNLLEIMSYGDLSKGLNDEPWAMRDLNLENYKSAVLQGIHCGWLRKVGESEYVIQDCGVPHRITHQQIDEQLKAPIFANWVSSFRDARGQKLVIKTGAAKEKRRLFNARKEVLEEARSWRNERGEEITATLVLTGQPSIKYDKDGKGTLDVRYGDAIKYKEFLFPQPIKEISVREEVMKNFNFAYPDEKLKRLPLPVFFHTSILQDEDGKQPEVVHSFGLAYMYKIPFTHSVKDAIRRYQEGSGAGPDLAECIFGHVEKDKALRGRVTFGHAFAVNVRPNVGDIKNEVLNSPKATYYPTYIRQDIKPNGKVKDDKYKTLFDKDAVPAGWKRYPVHSGTVETNPGPKDNNGNYNEKIQTRFQPLAAGTQFTCTVFYHNLNKIELGALLSALTFHNSQGCFHTLGMAKPLGYGKCTITVSGIDDTLKQKCLCKYEEYMKNKLGIDWLNSDQLRDLFAMSRNQENKGRSELKYMDDVKDFAKVKNQKLALDCYTNLEGIAAITINTACEAKLSEKPVAAEMAPNPKTEFERRKQQLIKDLQEKRSTLEAKEQQEREAEALRKLVVEQERLQQEKEAEVKRKQQTDAAAELAAGINLNGVTERKTIDGLLRTTKRWVETLNGSIETSEIDRIKSRFSQLYSQLRAKDRQTWLQHLKNDLPKLEPFLSKPQIQELEEHVNSLHNGKSC